jgi:hypothetical protein
MLLDVELCKQLQDNICSVTYASADVRENAITIICWNSAFVVYSFCSLWMFIGYRQPLCFFLVTSLGIAILASMNG